MKRTLVIVLALLPALGACRRDDEVEVTETRPLTTRDKSPKLQATSDERFRDAKPAPVRGETPDGWLKLPGTQFRLLNYRFGESGLGEVWVSISAGSVRENVNRWLAQFDAAPLDDEGFGKLRQVPIAGGSGVWVEAEGDYAPGMGAPSKPGQALAGVVASLDGDIVTVKMVGPKAEVLAGREVLETFAKNLKLAD
ncbi:MAG TPA: hypothetical protein VLO11_10440 [Luteolibacter sp.]|nr:hypothetical protein [Luteolibacter sp.]